VPALRAFARRWRAKEAGIEPLVIERDAYRQARPLCRLDSFRRPAHVSQRAKGITDSPELFAGDIQHKAKGEADQSIVEVVRACVQDR